MRLGSSRFPHRSTTVRSHRPTALGGRQPAVNSAELASTTLRDRLLLLRSLPPSPTVFDPHDATALVLSWRRAQRLVPYTRAPNFPVETSQGAGREGNSLYETRNRTALPARDRAPDLGRANSNTAGAKYPRQDSNLRPSAPELSGVERCANPRKPALFRHSARAEPAELYGH